MSYVFSNYYVTVLQAAASTAVTYVANLDSSASYSETLLYSELQATTIYNTLSALEALQMRRGLNQIYTNLEYLIAASLSITADQREFISNRISAVQKAALSIESVSASSYDASVKFPEGDPAVTDCGYLTWLYTWGFETAPEEVSYANVVEYATADLAAWSALYDAVQGTSVPGITVDTIGLILRSATENLTVLKTLSLSEDADASTLWSVLVSCPVITYAAESIVCDPTSYGYQALRCLRYSLLYLYTQANRLLVNLRNSTPAKVRTAIVVQNDTIMSFASRTLGDFERFTEIIALNGLVPPYISSQKTTGVAAPGDKLFLPTVSGTANTDTSSSIPDYLSGVLGVDLYLGPSGADMLTWTGDFQTISGYSNLSLSLGRRLQTPLGSLDTHMEYGSRIPGALGAIAAASVSGHLQAYASAAITTDPRVDQIAQLTVTYSSNFAVSVTATVVPVGPGSSMASVSIAENVSSS